MKQFAEKKERKDFGAGLVGGCGDLLYYLPWTLWGLMSDTFPPAAWSITPHKAITLRGKIHKNNRATNEIKPLDCPTLRGFFFFPPLGITASVVVRVIIFFTNLWPWHLSLIDPSQHNVSYTVFLLLFFSFLQVKWMDKKYEKASTVGYLLKGRLWVID